MDLFGAEQFKVDKPIRLIELFGGIGSQAMAFRDIGVDFEIYKFVELDKSAVNSYNAIHGTNFKPIDIKDVKGLDLEIKEKDKYCYLMTYSFPCTDMSLAGLQKGMDEGSGTSSSLLWEVKRLLCECDELLKKGSEYGMPDVLVMENVVQVHNDQNRPNFEKWVKFLEKLGYQNFCEDLNAKDYGIPQSRDRCFMVSILSEKSVDYEFPKKIPLKYKMKDFLENDVEEEYYLKSENADKSVKEFMEKGELK